MSCSIQHSENEHKRVFQCAEKAQALRCYRMRRAPIALLFLAACSSSPDTVYVVELPDGSAQDRGAPDVAVVDAPADVTTEEATPPRDTGVPDAPGIVDAAPDVAAVPDAGKDAAPPPDAGATIGWPSPCDSCFYDPPHDCAGIGAPDSGPYTAFTCAMACNNPPPTLTSGPSHCYYIGQIGPTTFEMCCPSSNPGF